MINRNNAEKKQSKKEVLMSDSVTTALNGLKTMSTTNGVIVVTIVAVLVTIGLAKVLMRKVTKA